ncbi:hypothetical protein EGT50_04245 [Rhodococcus xishaensis]|uniref:Uncharacterized protein n=1 Tax=Rhodococcus xishaensis TaxID=2487364 RepID=A0A3S3ADX9_9NOCA|nr:hypothetical protein EGT50_04245 [Rhodococcus xishaensis]
MKNDEGHWQIPKADLVAAGFLADQPSERPETSERPTGRSNTGTRAQPDDDVAAFDSYERSRERDLTTARDSAHDEAARRQTPATLASERATHIKKLLSVIILGLLSFIVLKVLLNRSCPGRADEGTER